MKKLLLEITEKEAHMYGLVRCKCGYPKNNHFDFGKKLCAHTKKCTGYSPVPVVGKFVSKKQ